MATDLDFSALHARIVDLQDQDGRIRWVDEGLWDPWNHTEAALGLLVMGDLNNARRAFDHLIETQRDDGSWRADMGAAAPMDTANERLDPTGCPTIVDTNFTAYPAMGVWALVQASGAASDLERYGPMAAHALDFVLNQQKRSGAFAWRLAETNETVEHIDALKAGSAAISMSLGAGAELARARGKTAARLIVARARAREALRSGDAEVFADKSRFAMDWYYPALSGALPIPAARAALAARWAEFVHPVWGCRCVNDEPWATAAETAELALACLRVGAIRAGERLLTAIARMAETDGVPAMGRQFALNVDWPLERPSWTAGAVLLAADAARGGPIGALYLEQVATLTQPA